MLILVMMAVVLILLRLPVASPVLFVLVFRPKLTVLPGLFPRLLVPVAALLRGILFFVLLVSEREVCRTQRWLRAGRWIR